MTITVELPDNIVQQPDPARAALEALAIEGYRTGALTGYQVRVLLGLTRFELDAFLYDRNVWEHAYSQEDLEQDRVTLARLDHDRASTPPTQDHGR